MFTNNHLSQNNGHQNSLKKITAHIFSHRTQFKITKRICFSNLNFTLTLYKMKYHGKT